MTKRAPLPRQIFVLTSEEKKAVACVLAMLLLGAATMHYRSTHPRPAAPPTAKELRAAKTAAARARSARGLNIPPSPSPASAEEDE